MWINLEKNECELIAKTLREQTGEHCQALASKIDDAVTDRFADTAAWLEAAKRIHHVDGEVEVDEQADGSTVVSISEDGGAYVMAWVWVYNEDAGFPAKEEEA